MQLDLFTAPPRAPVLDPEWDQVQGNDDAGELLSLVSGPWLPGLDVAPLAALLRARPELLVPDGGGYTLTAPDGSALSLHVYDECLTITSWREPPSEGRVSWVMSCMPAGRVKRTIAGIVRARRAA